MGTHCAVERSLWKKAVMEGRIVLTMLPSTGVIKAPSITAIRISHLDSSPFLVADSLVSVMVYPELHSVDLGWWLALIQRRRVLCRQKLSGKAKLDTRQLRLYSSRDGRTTILYLV